MKLRVEEAVREYMHQHDDGVCRPDCMGCFIIQEAKADMKALELQTGRLRDMLNKIRGWAYRDQFGPKPTDLAGRILALIEDGKSEKRVEDEPKCPICLRPFDLKNPCDCM